MDQKIALVTGGNRGIGAVICKKLALNKYFVYINCRNRNNTQDLFDEIYRLGGNADILEFDVTDLYQIENAFKSFAHSRLDLLVNNAGILKDNLIYQIKDLDWEKIIQTNFFGALAVYKVFHPKLLASDLATVINIGSISGIKPRKGQLAYAVSKSMLIEWTKLKSKNHNDRIHYFSLSPGPVSTDLIKDSPWHKDLQSLQRIPLGRYAEVEEVAEMVLFLCSPTNPLRNGSNVIFDGGFIQTVKEA